MNNFIKKNEFMKENILIEDENEKIMKINLDDYIHKTKEN